MLAQLLIAGLLFQTGPATPKADSTPKESSQNSAATANDDPNALLKIKRIYVDSFGDDPISREVQSMVVSSLVSTNKFKVTENRDRADAVLKGVAVEKNSQELHAYSEGTAVGGLNGGAAINDSSTNTESIQQAKISVRLVNPDGDVIWTSTQESKGGKYKGSSADAADKCVKQLIHDIERLKASDSSSPPVPPVEASEHK